MNIENLQIGDKVKLKKTLAISRIGGRIDCEAGTIGKIFSLEKNKWSNHRFVNIIFNKSVVPFNQDDINEFFENNINGSSAEFEKQDNRFEEII